MDITGQYFCSFNIKGQPYNEEFKVVLEATVSVYNALGELQTRIISKLPSKQILIKTLMKENLEQGLELSDVVFDKQSDEIQNGNEPKAKNEHLGRVGTNWQGKRFNNNNGRGQHGIIIRNNIYILQKIRLDCFWVHLPDDGIKNNSSTDTRGEDVSENPPITIIHKTVIPLETNRRASQEKESQSSKSQPKRLVSLLDTSKRQENNTTSIGNEDGSRCSPNNAEIKIEPDIIENIKKEIDNEESGVVPVGLPFMSIAHAIASCEKPAETTGVDKATCLENEYTTSKTLDATDVNNDEQVTGLVNDSAPLKPSGTGVGINNDEHVTSFEKEALTLKKLDTVTVGINSDEQVTSLETETVQLKIQGSTVEYENDIGGNLNDSREFGETLNTICPDTDNIETNEVIDNVDNDNGHLMLFCADVRKNEIGAFVNINAKGDEVSHTEAQESETQTLPVNLDHTYRKRKQVRKQTKRRGKSKVANGEKSMSSRFGKRKREIFTDKRMDPFVDLGMDIAIDLGISKVEVKTDDLKLSKTNDQQAEAINSDGNDLKESDMEAKISDTESGDNSGRRKRRRCSRNVNYKALVESLDMYESESEENVSDGESVSGPEADEVSQDFDSQNEDIEKEAHSDICIKKSDSDKDNSEVEPPPKTKKPKAVVDPDYQPDSSGISGDEDNEDDSSSVCSMDEEDSRENSEEIERKRKLAEMKMKVILEEHEDKFEIVKFVSSEQRNRGKSLEEKSHDAFACKICNSYQTSDKDTMSLHIGQHLKGKLRCKLCNFECSSASRKLHHIRQEHPTKTSIYTVCEQCGVPFSSNKSRQRHMYNVHQVPAFDCRFCRNHDENSDEKFATASELRRHAIECHRDELYECRRCGNYFIERHMYKKHKRICKESKENQNVTCSKCGETVASKHQLAMHQRRVHRKEKLCKCTMCDYTAFSIYSVTRHMAHAHLGMYLIDYFVEKYVQESGLGNALN